MRKTLIPAILLAVSLPALAQMTNEDVVKMAQQGISQAALIEAVNSAKSQQFHVTPQDQPALEAASVPKPVIVAMVRRVMRDGARSIAPSPEVSKPASSSLVSSPKARRVPSSEWGLDRGRPEFAWHGGGGTFRNRGGGYTSEWYTGAGVAVGLTPHLAAFGDYSYSEMVGFTSRLVGGASIHDVIGGLRVSRAGRISPYGIIGAGLSHLDAAVVTRTSLGFGALTKPAIAVGGGLNVSLSRRIGINSDFRAVRPTDFVWYSRGSGGLFFRF